MLNEIKKIFLGREPKILGDYEKSSVILFLIEEKGKLYILFEVRALNLNHQPGDISLPGGKTESGEAPRDTAIREAMEELNIESDDIEILGEMDYVVSPYNMIIYPFIGKLKRKEIHPNKEEVNHVFRVPLEYFMENEPISYEVKVIPDFPEDFPYHLIIGGKNYKFRTGKMNQYFYQYNGYVIWGVTALIIKSFVETFKKIAK